MADGLESLTEIKNVREIKKLGLEQYTPVITRSFCLSKPTSKLNCKEQTISPLKDSSDLKGLHPTHYTFYLHLLRSKDSEYAVYSFVFYGPKRASS